MEIEKQISKELDASIGFDPQTLKVEFDVKYEGKYLESELKNKVALVNLVGVIVEKSENKIDNVIFDLLKSLLAKLKE